MTGKLVERFFFDTYALVEKLKGTPSYEPYANLPVFTHQLNIYELATVLIRSLPESRARAAVRGLGGNVLEADLDDVFAASSFKIGRSRQRCSYADALGYVLAKRHAMGFLTGDRRFKGLDGVEFVP